MVKTLQPELDFGRLRFQLERVKYLMSDGRKRTLGQISDSVKGSEAGVSARLRQLRSQGHTVLKERVGDPRSGLWTYWMET